MRRGPAIVLILALPLLAACPAEPPPPAVAPPPPEEGPGVVEGMVSQSRDGGGVSRFPTGEGLLEGMTAAARDGGRGSREGGTED